MGGHPKNGAGGFAKRRASGPATPRHSLRRIGTYYRDISGTSRRPAQKLSQASAGLVNKLPFGEFKATRQRRLRARRQRIRPPRAVGRTGGSSHPPHAVDPLTFIIKSSSRGDRKNASALDFLRFLSLLSRDQWLPTPISAGAAPGWRSA